MTMSRVTYDERPSYGVKARVSVLSPNKEREIKFSVTQPGSLIVELDGSSFVITETELRSLLELLAAGFALPNRL